MNNNNIIIIVDPKPSLFHLISALKARNVEIQELCSHTCNRTLALNRTDLSRVAFALSGSDMGISIAHDINMILGLSGPIDSAALYNKVSQYHAIRAVEPSLAFEGVMIFKSQKELRSYLMTCDHKIVIRPDVSSINGSALVYDANYPSLEPEIERLFLSAKQVLTHPFIKGTSYFFNGILYHKKLYLTDTWQCFDLMANDRNILTSVISRSVDDPVIIKMKHTLQKLSQYFLLDFCPIHFEVVKNDHALKIVKMVPRIATEPLPTLCGLAGIKNQLESFDALLKNKFNEPPMSSEKLNQYVADYSFIVRNRGHLLSTNRLNHVMQLSSYHHIYSLPGIGSLLQKTTCGATYGATVLLRNSDKAALQKDIDICQALNENDMLELI
ncbi:MAG: hypothetical protein Q8R24_01225 [Legionellaceae bacterium]|nr:hypothetical protein [Legionellaceae bacterium]